jgi:hypothetical protein
MLATIASDHTFAILASTRMTFIKNGKNGRKLSLHVGSPHAHKRKFTNLEVPNLLSSMYKTVRRRITELPRVGVEGTNLNISYTTHLQIASIFIPLQKVPFFKEVISRYHLNKFSILYSFNRGRAVAQLDKALRYKPAGRRFDSQWCHWNFSVT